MKILSGLILAAALIAVGAGVRANIQESADAFEGGDYRVELRELERLAADGDAEAQYNLGAMYHMGRGVAQNYTLAAEWYRKAAEQGNMAAQHNLGMLYYTGRGVAQNFRTAAEWYRKAAEQGLAVAQNNLGVMYANGKGVEPDLVQALKWFNLAAMAGFENAQRAKEYAEANMNHKQVEEAQMLAREWLAKHQ